MARKSKAVVNTLFNDVASESDQVNELPINEIFARGRVARKQTIEQVAQALCIRSLYIQALEEGNAHQLPEAVYTLGFVRSYAQYLDLDPQYMVDRFKREVLGMSERHSAFVMPTPIPEKSTPKLSILLGSTALIIGIAAWWHYHSSQNQSNDLSGTFSTLVNQIEQATAPTAETTTATSAAVEPTPEAQPISATTSLEDTKPSAPVPSESVDSTSQNSTPSGGDAKPVSLADTPSEAAPTKTPDSMAPETLSNLIATSAKEPSTPSIANRITLTAEAKTWIEIRDAQGKVVVNKLLSAGESYGVPPVSGLFLSTGNAGGTQIMLDGKPIGVLGKPNVARRHVSLDPEKISQSVNQGQPQGARPTERPRQGAKAPARSANTMATPFVMPSVVQPSTVAPE
jgi:cytoskeleton protein RodZ